MTKTPHKSVYYRKAVRLACLEHSAIRISNLFRPALVRRPGKRHCNRSNMGSEYVKSFVVIQVWARDCDIRISSLLSSRIARKRHSLWINDDLIAIVFLTADLPKTAFSALRVMAQALQNTQ
jgi:hypothetical protein